MRRDVLFLRTLSKELKYLPLSDKNEFIDGYNMQIQDRLKNNESIDKIIDSLEEPSQIAKNIYAELEIDVKNAKVAKNSDHSAFNRTINYTLLSIPIFIFSILGAAFIVSSVIVILSTFVAFVVSIYNFDPLPGLGIGLLSVGLIPLISFALFAVGWYSLKFTNLMCLAPLSSETKEKNKFKKIFNNKIGKITFIVFVSVFGAMTLFGSIGSFSTNQTLYGSTINKELIHTQDDYLELGKIENYKYNVDLSSFKDANTWWDVDIEVNNDLKSNEIRVLRKHNTKESSKLTYKIDSTSVEGKEEYAIFIDIIKPWNEVVANIVPNYYIIQYNDKANITLMNA